MKTPYLLSQKGWRLYSSGNALATYSSLLIAFTLLIAVFLVLGTTALVIDPLVLTICAIIIVAFDLLAIVLIFVGRLVHWKGLTLLLGAAQITDTFAGQDSVSEEAIAE